MDTYYFDATSEQDFFCNVIGHGRNSDPLFSQCILLGGLSLPQSVMYDLNSMATLLPIALLIAGNIITLQCI